MRKQAAALLLGLWGTCAVSAAPVQYTASAAQINAKQTSGFLGNVAAASPVKLYWALSLKPLKTGVMK